MNTNTDYAILIITHNHASHITNLIESCRNIGQYPIYICDAASSDNTYSLLEHEIDSDPRFHLTKKVKLESFSKNNNDLIRKYSLQGKNIILINPDCYFRKEAFHSFIDSISHVNGIGVAAPLLHYPDGSIQPSWRKFPSLKDFLKKRLLRSKNNSNHHLREIQRNIFQIDWALGAFLFISKKLTTSPPLDERYRLYCEDSDICMQAHASNLLVVGVRINGIFHALQERSAKSIFSKYNYWNLSSGIKFGLKWKMEYISKIYKLHTYSTHKRNEK